jgi:hypothetical protein
MQRMPGALLLAACLTLLVGCQANVVDRWPISARTPDCASRASTAWSCVALLAAAATALDARDGQHADIVSANLYLEVDPPFPREAGDIVAVFALSDGTRRAILTGWSPGGSHAVDYGP